MSIGYDCISTAPVVKAHFDRFVLKGEDFQFAHPLLQVGLSFDGIEAKATFGIFGVFDGHGGKDAAQFASKQVPERFVKLLEQALEEERGALDLSRYLGLANEVAREDAVAWMLQDAVVQLAPATLRSVFLQVNDDYVADHERGGTTATVAVVVGNELIVASVGDSLAYLDTGDAVLQVSANHRIDSNARERERITAAGGDISPAEFEGQPMGPDRVWPGGLAFSRSIGDVRGGDLLLAEPEVMQVHISNRGARLIVASDGAWDAISGPAAARRVRALPATKAAPNLKVFCKSARETDDITVIIVDMLSDADAKLPDALTPAARASSKALLHVESCSASLASTLNEASGPFRAIWRPLEPTDKHNADAWLQFSLSQRAEALEALTRSADLDQAVGLSGDVVSEDVIEDAPEPPSGTLYEELSALHVNLDEVALLDAGSDEDDDDGDEWETVGGKRSHDAPRVSDAVPGASRRRGGAAREKGGRGSGDRGGRGRDKGRGRGRGRQEATPHARGRGRPAFSENVPGQVVSGDAGGDEAPGRGQVADGFTENHTSTAERHGGSQQGEAPLAGGRGWGRRAFGRGRQGGPPLQGRGPRHHLEGSDAPQDSQPSAHGRERRGRMGGRGRGGHPDGREHRAGERAEGPFQGRGPGGRGRGRGRSGGRGRHRAPDRDAPPGARSGCSPVNEGRHDVLPPSVPCVV